MASGARKTDEQKRSKSLHIRLTEKQREAIERAARKSTLDPSTWVRMIALRSTDWNPDEEPQ